jgi:regulation of enolase protein 1 (concanavalin A-like superfamily)
VKSWTFSNKPTEQYEQADLVWYYDDGNMVKCGQELVDGKLCIVMGRKQDDKCRTIKILPLESTTVSVRIIVKDKTIRGQFKTPDAKEWTEVGECDVPEKGRPKISLQFYQGPRDLVRWVRVTGFRVTAVP